MNLAHRPAVRIFAWLGADMEFDWLGLPTSRDLSGLPSVS